MVIVACLVTDKKYRKMGGEEGLKISISKLEKERAKARKGVTERTRVYVEQIPVEDLIQNDNFSINLQEMLGKRYGLSTPFEGSKVVLVHKHSDFYKIPGIEGERISKLGNWLSEMSSSSLIRVLDDPVKIEVLSSRIQTGNLVREMCKGEGFEGEGLQWPEFNVEMDYPVIVKPIDACSTDEAHWMTLIVDGDAEDDEKKRKMHEGNDRVLVQKFYEHYGILYKVYVIGDSVEIVARPSISTRDINSSFRFNTHKFKALAGDLSEDVREEAVLRMTLIRGLVERFAWRLKEKLQLTWFGIDVIIPEDGNDGVRAAVIDVNYMPGFDGVSELSDKLIKAILE